MRMRIAGLALAGLVLAGCSTGPDTAPLVPSAADADLVGAWQGPDGRNLPDGSDGSLVVRSSAGSATCSREDATVFLELAWPVGTESSDDASVDDSDSRRFVRDTSGSTFEIDGRPSDLDVTLPDSADPTGFTRAGNTLSVDEQEAELYVTRPDGHSERWGRLSDETGCG